MKPNTSAYIVTFDSPTNHGGRVMSTSSSMAVDGYPVALVGDKVMCPIHGETTIVSGCSRFRHRGKAVAIVGSMQTRSRVVVHDDDSIDVVSGADHPADDD